MKKIIEFRAVDNFGNNGNDFYKLEKLKQELITLARKNDKRTFIITVEEKTT